jgi:hypothetical protein
MLCTISMTKELYQGFQLFTCVHYDDIVHKINAARFRIFVPTDFSVSAHTCIYKCSYVTYSTIHTNNSMHCTYQKTLKCHLFFKAGEV